MLPFWNSWVWGFNRGLTLCPFHPNSVFLQPRFEARWISYLLMFHLRVSFPSTQCIRFSFHKCVGIHINIVMMKSSFFSCLCYSLCIKIFRNQLNIFINILLSDNHSLLFFWFPTYCKYFAGSSLNIIKRTVKYLCPADIIPPYIDVDLSELDVGQKIVAGKLNVHPALKLLRAEDEAVVKIMGARVSDQNKAAK